MDVDPFDLNRVAIFVRIVEAGGVTAAATRARLPKSSVSRALTQLEADLGVELVDRRGRAFQLTDAGKVFHAAAARGIEAVHEAKEDLQRDGAVLRGTLRVAAPPGIASVVVAPLIARFVRQHPEVDVELSVTAARLDPARDGLDVVLAFGPLEDSSAIARRIRPIDAGIFASPAHLAEHGVPRRPDDLARHPAILLRRTANGTRWVLEGPAGKKEVTVRGRIAVDDQHAALGAAAAGGGLAVLAIHLVHADPAGRSLQRVLPDWTVAGEPAHLLHAASRHVPRRITAFCDAVAEALHTSCERS